jgi:hypothetical protein
MGDRQAETAQWEWRKPVLKHSLTLLTVFPIQQPEWPLKTESDVPFPALKPTRPPSLPALLALSCHTRHTVPLCSDEQIQLVQGTWVTHAGPSAPSCLTLQSQQSDIKCHLPPEQPFPCTWLKVGPSLNSVKATYFCSWNSSSFVIVWFYWFVCVVTVCLPPRVLAL